MKPAVSRIVHYVSYGTPGGEYTSQCRAAVVTAVDTYKDRRSGDGTYREQIGLCVLNPDGMFFNHNVCQDEEKKRGGTWHWPERADD